MRFQYDKRKGEINFEKLGIGFERAKHLWDGVAIEAPTYPVTDESRTMVIGSIDGVWWTVITTERDGEARIVSVRRSRKEEVEIYERCKG